MYHQPTNIRRHYFGTELFINVADMTIDGGFGGNICLSGIQDDGGSFGILGDVFLKNVLAVYDIGASEMRFAARENY